MIVWQAAPSLRPFNPGEFLSTLVAQGPQLTSGVKGDWEGLYRRYEILLSLCNVIALDMMCLVYLTHFCPPFSNICCPERLTSLGIMGVPRVPPLNRSETIVLSAHYRL